jgi:hypothetical protein
MQAKLSSVTAGTRKHLSRMVLRLASDLKNGLHARRVHATQVVNIMTIMVYALHGGTPPSVGLPATLHKTAKQETEISFQFAIRIPISIFNCSLILHRNQIYGIACRRGGTMMLRCGKRTGGPRATSLPECRRLPACRLPQISPASRPDIPGSLDAGHDICPWNGSPSDALGLDRALQFVPQAIAFVHVSEMIHPTDRQATAEIRQARRAPHGHERQ